MQFCISLITIEVIWYHLDSPIIIPNWSISSQNPRDCPRVHMICWLKSSRKSVPRRTLLRYIWFLDNDSNINYDLITCYSSILYYYIITLLPATHPCEYQSSAVFLAQFSFILCAFNTYPFRIYTECLNIFLPLPLDLGLYSNSNMLSTIFWLDLLIFLIVHFVHT